MISLRTQLDEGYPNQHCYQEYSHGIFYCTTYSQDYPPPEQIIINEIKYRRWLDFIYMPCETHQLSKEQVIAVNQIRNNYYEKLKGMAVNKAVKQRIAALINQLFHDKTKRAVLEYGCGYQTLHSFLKPEIFYLGADIDPEAARQNKILDPKGRFIVVDTENMPIKKQSIDLIVSIFVFHFKVTRKQLAELFNLLTEQAVMIFNLYLLPQTQRQILFSELEEMGFHYHRESDNEQLCKDHEYCFLATTPDSQLFKQAIALFKNQTQKSKAFQGYIQFSLLTDLKTKNKTAACEEFEEVTIDDMVNSTFGQSSNTAKLIGI